MGQSVVLEPTAVATGGDGLARQRSGRVVLVAGALPGEQVEAVVTEARRGYARAVTSRVLRPAPERARPPCPWVAAGCGGCGWQHVQTWAQGPLKLSVVADNLRRLGHLEGPPVRLGPSVGPYGYRTTLRLAVRRGQAGLRRPRSHEVVPVESCLVAHPLLADLIGHGGYGRTGEATLRCGARTGQRLALLAPTGRGARLPPDVVRVGLDELASGAEAWFHEEVSGRRLRVSAASFFQSSQQGAELLVGMVREAADGAPPGRMVDAYGGVGLFAATVGEGRPVTLLETSRSAAADARVNLRDVEVVEIDVARWRPVAAALIVADPPRAGLGAGAIAVLAATGAGHLVLVSCDPASLGRDARLLAGHGFRLEWSSVVDLFPGTPHVETVSRFVR